jgi:hypothetical protein
MFLGKTNYLIANATRIVSPGHKPFFDRAVSMVFSILVMATRVWAGAIGRSYGFDLATGDAGGESRGHTFSREPDFESGASADSATPARHTRSAF